MKGDEFIKVRSNHCPRTGKNELQLGKKEESLYDAREQEARRLYTQIPQGLRMGRRAASKGRLHYCVNRETSPTSERLLIRLEKKLIYFCTSVQFLGVNNCQIARSQTKADSPAKCKTKMGSLGSVGLDWIVLM